MRKRTLCFILIALMLIGFFAHNSIVSAAFSWYLKGYCRSCLGGDLAYESLRRENGIWIVDKPTLSTKKKLSDGGHRFEADRAEINVATSWLERKIAFDIALEKPKIEVGQGAIVLKELFQVPTQEFRLLKIHTRFIIPEGEVLLHEFSGNQSVAVPLFFSIDLACHQSQEGCISLWFEEKNATDQPRLLKAVFSKLDKLAPQISILADDIDCSALMTVIGNIWPGCFPCVLKDGSIKGEAVITLPHHSSPYAEGRFVVQDLNMWYPLYELNCNVPELTLALSSKNSGRPHSSNFQTTAIVDVPKNAAITFSKNNETAWSIDALGGSLALRSDHVAKFNIDACCSHRGCSSKLNLDGNVHLDEENQSSMTLEFRLRDGSADQDAVGHFAIRQLGEHWNFAEVQLTRFGKRELDFFQGIFGRAHPQWQQVHLHDGVLDAAMMVYLHRLKVAEVRIENFAAHNLDLAIDPWAVSLGVADATGTLSLNFSVPDPLSTMDADLKISDGRLCIAGLDEAKWQLAEIHTDLAVSKGIVQKSLVKGEIAGLKGEIELDGNSASDLIRCQFSGNAIDLAKALPGSIRMGIENKFCDDKLQIIAGLQRHPEGLSARGKMIVGEGKIEEKELDFGFLLERASGFATKDGWFEGKNLKLEKYISPFIFLKNQIQLSGLGDFQGTFDTRRVKVCYEAHDVVLENSDFVIEVKNIGTISDEKGCPLNATHIFNIDKMRSSGTLPISNGTYFEKNSGLLFTDINAAMDLEDDMAHFSNVETFCNGLFFTGAIDLDWSMPGDGIFEIDIRAQEMQGKVSQVQHFFSHFNKGLGLLKFPIEGNVAFRKEGGYMHFFFFPGDYRLQTTLRGMMSDGTFSSSEGEISLQELCLNFDYDHIASSLEFSDIQGTILVGKPGHVEEYALAGDYFRFTNYAQNQAVFDIWAGDKKRDLVRLVGKTYSVCSGEDSKNIHFQFDNALTHFSDVHPDSFQLTLGDWSQINSLRLEFNFGLKTLLHDLQRFSRTGLFFLSRNLLKELNELKAADGTFKVDLGYDNNQALLTYRAEGTDITVGPYQFHQFFLAGRKKASTWTIDQLQFDNVSLAADILKDDEVWKVNFLGARFGKSLLLGLEGEYRHDRSLLNAKINLFEADLSSFHEWPFLNEALEELGFTGLMRGTGKVRMEFDRTKPQGIGWDVQMNIACRSGKFRDILLSDFENASIHYVSDKGFTIHNVNTVLRSALDESARGSLSLQYANFDFIQRELIVDGLSFRIPVKNLEWTADNLKRCFPDIISKSLSDAIRHAKKEGDVRGLLKIEMSRPHCALSLALEDGLYQFMDREYDLSAFVLEYDPFELKISSRYRYQKQCFWLTARCPAPALDSGEISLSPLPLEREDNPVTPPLTIYWRCDPFCGFLVQKIEGALCGLSLNLVRDESQPPLPDQISLLGAVHVDMTEAHALLNEDLGTKFLEWGIGSGYCLNGRWAVSKDSRPLSESLAFQGELAGRNFEFLGYQLYQMTAQIAYTSDALQASRITFTDPCGSILIDEMMVTTQPDGKQRVFMPMLSLSDFRPSQLHAKGILASKFPKTLVIRQLDLRDCYGNWGEKNSFEGKGRLTFANPPKKNLQHTIFAIPAEILTRLGLDLAVLNPIRGSIYYNIRDGKVILTRFKDVYSKGRVSKFYLANNGFQSCVDFDGNMNIQIRMKQYNIFFKLAELFTVTVQGTLNKPVYSLQKQPRQERANAI